MLTRSFARYLNSVYYAPDDGGGADVDTELDVSDTGGDGTPDPDSGDGGGELAEPAEGSQKPLSVRDEIKKAMAEASGDKPPEPKPAKKAPKKGAAPAAAAAPPAGNQPPPAAPQVPAPARLSNEAKADWAKTPPAIQQAFVKAEQDMAAGVEQLKQRYAGIDQAIAPHQDALRQMNATPGEAVNRMFLWFKALAANPREAFPALAKSMNQDWNGIFAPQQQGQPGQPQPGQPQQQAAAIPDEVRTYVSGLENTVRQMQQQMQQMQTGFGSIQNDIQSQNMQKTEENLTFWSKDKEFFNEVRQDMARLIQADPASLIKNGQVDLDAAYERAIYYNPDVRAKVLAKQQQANQEVQQQTTEAATTARQGQVARARKAAVSLPVSSPGDRNGPVVKKPQGRQSVRDSLRNAIAELREG